MLAPLVFDSPLLSAVHEAAERRGKAIRYYGGLQCSRERDDTGEFLRVYISSDARIDFCVWPDGGFWLGITKPRLGRAGGWEINEQFQGRVGDIHPPDLVKQLESTLTYHAYPDKIQDIWKYQHLTNCSS